MALIPQVKCSRCDRKYSGLRTRCPYCGTRRYAKSAKAVPADNSTWRVVVGALLLVVLIAAVVVLVVTSGNETTPTDTTRTPNTDPSKEVTTVVKDSTETTNPGSTETPTPGTSTTEPGSTTDPGTTTTTPGTTTTEPGTTTTEPGTPTTPVENTTPKASVNSVVMTYGGYRVGQTNKDGKREFTLTRRDETIQLGVKVTPEGVDYTAIWESLDENVAIVNQSGKVTWVGAGSTTLRVTVDGISDEVIIRCSK
ncbi:MAG: Ig-like domain-containing protein [bacterium]